MKRFFLIFAVALIASQIVQAFDRDKYDEILLSLYDYMNASDISKMEQQVAGFEKKNPAPGSNIASSDAAVAACGYGILCHNISRDGFAKGKRGFAAKAVAILTAVFQSKAAPEELKPVVHSYLGSAYTLVANESSDPVQKITSVNNGMRYLDDAVSKYRNVSIWPSYIRGSVCLSLPESFKTLDKALSDFIYLEKIYRAGNSEIPTMVAAQIFLDLGNIYKKNKNLKKALQYWKEANTTSPDSAAGKEALETIRIFEE